VAALISTPRKTQLISPQILDYHGRGGTSNTQYNTSQYDVYDTAGDFLVAYPQGLVKPGATEAAWFGATYSPPNADDLGFTAALV
jgi:poly(3-hydroxybutyrate) depolymerase